VRALDIRHLTVRYNDVVALEDITMEIEEGERIALVGPNGAGKSTLFKAVVGLVPLQSGEIRVFGQLHDDVRLVSYVPQRNEVDWDFPVTVRDVVMMGRFGELGWFRWPGRRDREIVERCLEDVGMTDFADRQIGELSGGQQQRVFIARALAQEARLILMDEPFAGVDMNTERAIFATLDALQERGITVLLSTHNLNMAAAHFSRMALLNRRLIAFGHPSEVLKPAILPEAYGDQIATWRTTEEGLTVLCDHWCAGCDLERRR